MHQLMLPLTKFTRAQLLLLVLLCICFNYVRLKYRIEQPLAEDERFQVHYMKSYSLDMDGLKSYVKRLPTTDRGRLPLSDYLICWPLAHWFSQNKYVMCIPYVLAANLFFWLFAFVNWGEFLRSVKEPLSKAFSFNWLNLISVSFFTFNETAIKHAFEIRNWGAFTCLQGILSFLLTWKMTQNRFRWKYLFGCLLILGFHFYGVIMLGISLASHTASMSYQLENKPGKKTLQESMKTCSSAYGTFIVACLIASPLWLIYGGPLQGVNTHEYIHLGWRGIIQVFSLLFHNPVLRNLSILPLVFGTVWMLKRWHMPIIFAIMMVEIPILTIYALDLLNSYWFVQRQFLWVVPYWDVFVACSIFVSLAVVKNYVNKVNGNVNAIKRLDDPFVSL